MNNTKENTISIIELTQKSYHSYRHAFLLFKEGKVQEAESLFMNADELLLEASRIHTEILLENIEIYLLLVYVEDLFISVQLYKSMINELVEVYKSFPTLKGN